MELSIVIADSRDLKIRDCVNSIDENVEVIVSLNDATDELVKLTKTLGVRTCETKERGLALALNRGIEKANNSKILIVDSDFTFEKGTIRRLYKGVEDNDSMVRGRVIYNHDNILSKIVAKAREYHANSAPKDGEIKAYKPLLFDRRIKDKMGGRFYDNDLKLSEDYEMDTRRRKAGIKIKYIPEAVVHHAPISPIHDLESAYKYGLDRHTTVIRGLTKPKKGTLSSLKKLISHGRERLGFTGILYMALWTLAYDLGYHTQDSFNINGVKR